MFTDVVKESSSTCLSQDTVSSCCDILYKTIVKQHLMVMINQFRKDILESFNIETKMSHRKRIQVSKERAKSKAAVDSSESITEEKKLSLKVNALNGNIMLIRKLKMIY